MGSSDANSQLRQQLLETVQTCLTTVSSIASSVQKEQREVPPPSFNAYTKLPERLQLLLLLLLLFPGGYTVIAATTDL